ncbi:MAG TPA: glycine zipper 2TM domain-containing protein [Alphaproteobacteria bacterium]|nr:glycine zipper 2TM domain-containing protein [Alphaproteobacteria bacterium]
MRAFLLGAVAALAIGALSAMPAYAAGENQFVGTLVGAGVGGLVGNQFGRGDGRVATTAAGVLVGGFAGNAVGASLDREDAYDSAYYSEPGYVYYPGPVYFQTTYVPNYVAPPAYDASPSPYYDTANSDYCREFTQEATVAGHEAETYGTACLQPDGSWRVVR